jgi:hypothetical protein
MRVGSARPDGAQLAFQDSNRFFHLFSEDAQRPFMNIHGFHRVTSFVYLVGLFYQMRPVIPVP